METKSKEKVTTKTNQDVWPIGSNHFKVSIGGNTIPFQIVSGLKARFEVVEYRSGDSKMESLIKMPLTASFSDVVLKKGMFKGDNFLLTWFNKVGSPSFERDQVIIQLLDIESKPLFTWTLANAFPREITFGEFDAMKATYAVEELVIAYENLTIDTEAS